MKKYLALIVFALLTAVAYSQGKCGYSDNRLEPEPGYKGIVEMGNDIGAGEWGLNRIKLNLINGYKINQYISFGIGTGLRYYYDIDAMVIPIYADFRANFMDYKVTPYLSLGVGYSFGATNNFKGDGILLNPTVGVSYKLSSKSSMNVGLGYEMQRMMFKNFHYSIWGDKVIFANSGAISFNVGISFYYLKGKDKERFNQNKNNSEHLPEVKE